MNQSAESAEERLRLAEIEARAQAISRNVRCQECGHQSIEESGADIAILLRKLIRDELKKGLSEKEIYNKLSDEFGESILYKPKFDVQTAGLYLMPAALMGGAALMAYRRRQLPSTTRAMTDALLQDVPLTQREKEALYKLLDPPKQPW